MFKLLKRTSPNDYVIERLSLGVSLFPKAGSTSFRFFLYEIDHGRPFVKENKDVHQWCKKKRKNPSDHCKHRFALIRDPIERFISCYNNKVIQKRLLDNIKPKKPLPTSAVKEHPYPSFEEFLDNFSEFREVPTIGYHTRPISEFLKRRKLNFFTEVFTFEQIEVLAKRINEIAGTDVKLPHRQKSKNERWQGAPKRTKLLSLSHSQIHFLTDLYADEYKFLEPYYSKIKILEKWQEERKALELQNG